MIRRFLALTLLIPLAVGFVGCPAPALRAQQHKTRTNLQMMDQNILIGVAAGAGGLIAGLGIMAFTESQGERTSARGSLSEDMALKLSAKLMEDIDVDDTDVQSVTSKMREALAQAQTDEETAAMDRKKEEQKMEDLDDGW
ncbi:unnamed protein product [Chrysoparadoxa australica]